MIETSRRDLMLTLAAASAVAGGVSMLAAPAVAQTVAEPPIDPTLPIIDAHHHLAASYTFENFAQDIKASGHNVLATVYVDCSAFYRADGPPAMKALGEVEFANGVAAESASGVVGKLRVCQGIVGHVDLADTMAPAVLDAQMAAAGKRFKGVRVATAWDADPNVLGSLASWVGVGARYLYDDRFRKGYKELGKRGLSFDAWILEPQLGDVRDLARAFPNTPLVLNHLGTPLGVASYKGKQSERFPIWRKTMQEIASSPNVTVKLSALAGPYPALAGPGGGVKLSSEELAKMWRPYVETTIELFGAKRCMFASDFQVDKAFADYGTIFNAFKRIVSGASKDEKHELFVGAATRAYRLPPLNV